MVAALGTAQTLAWASSYYLPAILADPIAHGTGVSRTVVFGLFSAALLLSAVFGPAVGRAIDQHGGRGVLAHLERGTGRWSRSARLCRMASCCRSLGPCSASAWRWAFMNPPSRL